MISRAFKITDENGFHIKPSKNLCQSMMDFKSSIKIVCGNREANAKSLLSVLGAQIKQGDEVEFIIDGEDEEEAMKAILDLLENV
jgi:phosphocarrier protein